MTVPEVGSGDGTSGREVVVGGARIAGVPATGVMCGSSGITGAAVMPWLRKNDSTRRLSRAMSVRTVMSQATPR